jgi:hypothetical protein
MFVIWEEKLPGPQMVKLKLYLTHAMPHSQDFIENFHFLPMRLGYPPNAIVRAGRLKLFIFAPARPGVFRSQEFASRRALPEGDATSCWLESRQGQQREFNKTKGVQQK